MKNSLSILNFSTLLLLSTFIRYRATRGQASGKERRKLGERETEIYIRLLNTCYTILATIEHRIRGGSERGRRITDRNKESNISVLVLGISTSFLPLERFPISSAGSGSTVKTHDISST